MDDSISRRAVSDAIYRIRCNLQMMDDSQTADKMMSGMWLVEKAIKQLPSAQLDIKQAAKLLSDFIESCPGGDSYLITPDGEELRTDWGYATEGIQLIYDWAERRSDG